MQPDISSNVDLELFVKMCDDLGGLGDTRCQHYMGNLNYQVLNPSTADPLSDQYFDFQIQLYEIMSGRKLDQTLNEMTNFNLSHHVAGSNPYRDISPSDAALHLQRLLKMYRAGNIPPGGQVLDMGAGWGLSSEICAYIGCNVTAVDVNPAFVSLVNSRAERSRLPIVAEVGTFDTFTTDRKFDLISFYECLHHATKPWAVIERMAALLNGGGKITIAGEPINEHWWPSWGLRLDPLSIYCIRKFGWFESGWSEKFICECFRSSGLKPQVILDSDPQIGTVVVASK